MRSLGLILGVLGIGAISACEPPTGGGGGNGGEGNQNAGGDHTSTGGSGTGNNGAGGDLGLGGTQNQGGGAVVNCDSGPDEDKDGDGITKAQGDCNDCDVNVNPGAIDVIVTEPDENGMVPKPADEDCNGVVDDYVAACDDGLTLTDGSAASAAKAIDLCQTTTAAEAKWGVLSSAYVRANGTAAAAQPLPAQYGIFDDFGFNVNVQRGKRMLGLSSGKARRAADPGNCGSITCQNGITPGPTPAGFPQDVPNCDGSTTIYDDVALQLKIRTPKNATGYFFNFKFYSFEFPEWVCTSYNDQFIALVDPPPAGSINGNISFDANTNPVSVNIAFFDVCDPASVSDWAFNCNGGCPPAPSPYCPSGTNELLGTGFYEWDMFGGYAGGTSWLQTQAPVTGGDEITVRFAIWDTGDPNLDSTAVIDNFTWIANGGTVEVGTGEIPDPK